MQGIAGLLNIVTIPPGASDEDTRIVINGITGDIQVFNGANLVIDINSTLNAILVYAS